MAGARSLLRRNLLSICMALAMVLGILFGLLIRQQDPDFGSNDRKLMYLEFPGKLLMNMLKMIILPLIFASLVSGLANLPSKASGRLGLYAVAYYLLTTFLAVVLGILLVAAIRPGVTERLDSDSRKSREKPTNPVDSLFDLIRNAFPPNLVEAAIKKTVTQFSGRNVSVAWRNGTHNGTVFRFDDTHDFKVVTVDGSNILGIVVFSIALGVVISRMGEEGMVLRRFFTAFSNAIIALVRVIVWYAPIGIVFLLCSKIVAMDDPAARFAELGWYMMTVLVGLFIHAFVFLPLICFLLGRTNPFRLMLAMGDALLNALGTASSSATLPITMRCMQKFGVSKVISRFVLPVGATINMDGTALYEAVASIFIAQQYQVPLNASQYIIISLTSTAAAIGAAGVPEAGLVTMLIVLMSAGLPTEGVNMIIAVDWFLDRCRTAVNVWGDSIGVVVVERLGRKQLEQLESKDDQSMAESDFSQYDDDHQKHPSRDIGERTTEGYTNRAFDVEMNGGLNTRL